jgi:hypothetical protein
MLVSIGMLGLGIPDCSSMQDMLYCLNKITVC